MSSLTYVENVFIAFFKEVMKSPYLVDGKDYPAIVSFHRVITSDEALTENQAKFILRLLKKYQRISMAAGVDVNPIIENPVWKKEFRKIDLTKEVFLEVDDQNVPWICLKFPYILKEEFDKEIQPTYETDFSGIFGNSGWDKERKIRKLNFYDYNILQIQEFVIKNNFFMHESFVEAINLADEIWCNSDQILKKSNVTDDRVYLVNADPDTEDFFRKHQKNYLTDLLLAKSMGFVLEKNPENVIEKIAADENTWFWINRLDKVIEIGKEIQGKIVFVLDRSSDYKQWVYSFKEKLDMMEVSDPVRICFRENTQEDAKFNQWIKDNRFGGRVEEGKFLIFLQKPNKWLYNQLEEVKIVVTNGIYPPTDQMAMAFFKSHPCVIFAGDVKPTSNKGFKIVNL